MPRRKHFHGADIKGNVCATRGQYGNMTCVTNGQTNGLCANLSFNAANNHITSTGYTYDGAGNLTKELE